MKKILPILMISFILFVSACTLGNTPTSKVEDLLSKYQRLDTKIKDEIDETIMTETLTDEQRSRYRSVLERQYQNMSYEIKDEKIDGDTAVVTVSIEVVDYKKDLANLDSSNLSTEEYNNQKLDILEKSKDKVSYTLDLTVNKDDDGNWKVASLSEVDKKKLQGMY